MKKINQTIRLNWQTKDSMVYHLESSLKKKFIGLDLDDTLIRVKSKAKFAKD